MQKEQTKKERCEMKTMSESCEIVRGMQAGEISPLEGWRALKGAYAAMSPAGRVEDYICAARDMGCWSDSLEVVDAMQANEISPIEGWRALKAAYAAISPGDLLMDYKCTLAYMDYWEEMTPYPQLYTLADADLIILPEHIFFSEGWKPIHETKKS